MKTVFLLLIIYQIKHFIADYPLQGKYMLGKFKDGTDWIMPLFAHVMVHAALTFLICLYFAPQHAVILASLDAAIHFIMDRIKASPHMLGRFKALSANEYREIAYEQEHYIKKFPGTQTSLNMQEKFNERLKSNILFWWCLGIDQMVHHLTHYLVIYLILVLP
jgi:hypothetical protein